jgi:hypothetical protein
LTASPADGNAPRWPYTLALPLLRAGAIEGQHLAEAVILARQLLLHIAV